MSSPHPIDMSNTHDQQPITFEIPQIRKFYEDNLTRLLEETPFKEEKKIISFLTSPMDAPPLVHWKLLALRNTDIVTEILGSDFKFATPRPFRNFLNRASTQQKLFNDIPKNSIIRPQNPKNVLASPFNAAHKADNQNNLYYPPGPTDNAQQFPGDADHHGELKDAQKDYGMNFDGNGFSGDQGSNHNGEIRKRKRKSNQQLKVLKWEFEKEDYWNKDKIVHVAKMTGLSESQVYKWCWDQKKKKQDQMMAQNQNRSGNGNYDDSNKENFDPEMMMHFGSDKDFMNEMPPMSSHSKSIRKHKDSFVMAYKQKKESGYKPRPLGEHNGHLKNLSMIYPEYPSDQVTKRLVFF